MILSALALQATIDELINSFDEKDGSWKKMDELNLKNLETGDIIRVETASGNLYFLEVAFPATRLAHLYRHDQRETALRGYRGQRVIVALKVGREMFYTASSNPADARDCRKVHRTRNSNVQSIHILTA